jgi:omega-6 fatty acid desaturase (delta-12 desaturase)
MLRPELGSDYGVRVPEVLKKIPELQTPKTTSLNPMEIIRCLRLKVWDV